MECQKKIDEALISTINKKQPKLSKVKIRTFQLTVEEANEIHDVVSRTLVLNVIPSCTLFDSSATYPFLSHEFGGKLIVFIEPLDNVYVIKIANGKFKSICHMY